MLIPVRDQTLWRSAVLCLLVFFAALPGRAQSCPSPGLSIDRPLLTRDGCAAWRFIGLRTDVEVKCPEPTAIPGVTWRVRTLFKPDASGTVPAALRPYCVYRAEGASARTLDAVSDALEDLVDDGSLGGATASCAALRGVAESGVAEGRTSIEKILPANEAWSQWHEHFLVHAEALREGPDQPPFDPKEKSIRLAVLDTQPVAAGGALVQVTNSHHGRSLIGLAKNLVCHPGAAGDVRCAADIQPQLALHISQFNWQDESKTIFDTAMGGFYGTIDRLAEAVWDEVRLIGDQKLILNLSVAWVGEHFGGLEETPEQMPEPVRALYDAMRIASCEGALMVAAAGNRLGGPVPENGPLLPAGWERRPAPDDATCERLKTGSGATEALKKVADVSRSPLVYAVAGISGDGTRLANARPGSEPERVTYGDHVVVDTTGQTLTGSSVSAIVVSAAAAVAWSHDTDSTAHEIMERIWQAGRQLERSAQVESSDGAPREVRRLGICTALSAIVGGECQEPPPYLPCYTQIGCVGEELDFKRLSRIKRVDPFCGIQTIAFDPDVGKPEDPCPYRQYFGIQTRPWSGPQPQENPCSGCDIQPPPGTHGGDDPTDVLNLRIAIDSGWSGGPLGSVIFAAGQAGYALDLDLEAGDCVLIRNVDANLIRRRQNGQRPRLRLYFTTEQGASIESPVFIGGLPLEEKR